MARSWQMTEEKPKYYDVRCDFWRDHFDLALDYDAYLAGSEPEKAGKWREMEAKLPPLDGERVARLAAIERRMNVLVYSGVWCGDCVRQGPMIRRIVEACNGNATLRLIDRDVSEALSDELRILGALRVPAVVFLTEDFFEVGRFGDRLLTVYRVKAERELGAACDTGLVAPPAEQLAAEQTEWLDIFERMLLMARLSPPLRERYGD
jgi:hypothetical protein